MASFEFKITLGLKLNPIQVAMQNLLNYKVKMRREYIKTKNIREMKENW